VRPTHGLFDTGNRPFLLGWKAHAEKTTSQELVNVLQPQPMSVRDVAAKHASTFGQY
jgi:hypothetical protein